MSASAIDGRVGAVLGTATRTSRVHPSRFLAINDLPAGATTEDVRTSLERLARDARRSGLRPMETFYSLDLHRAYTLVEAGREEDVRALYLRAGIPVEVVPGERIHTGILDETDGGA